MTARRRRLLFLAGTLMACLVPAKHATGVPAAPPRETHRARPGRRVAARPATPEVWTAQGASWERLARDILPLARRGARLPTPKLAQYFRRQGLWPHPSFDPRKAATSEQALLSPTGPGSRPEACGPAGRAVWIEGTPEGPDAQAQTPPPAREACRIASLRCGLSCTQAPPLRPSREAPPRSLVRSLRRLLADHALLLTHDGPGGQIGVYTPSPHPADLAAHTGPGPSPAVPTADSLRPAILAAAAPLGQGAPQEVPQPLFRFTLGLRLPAPGARPAPASPAQIAETLCRLADRLPDEVHRAWTGTAAAREARALALGRWLGLRFQEQPVALGRPPLEQKYTRIHYRDRVFNFRQRKGDGAVLIRPLMVVIHDTGGMSASSALHTLRAKQIGGGQGQGHQPGSLSVGVPYLVARDGTIYRLFKDDSRFARHTIGLNHSALGIENVGNRHHPLSSPQLEANARLVEHMSLRYPVRWLLGHREVYQMARTGYYLEAVPGYCSDKGDPPWTSLRTLRGRVAHLQLETPPGDSPVLRSCADLLRFFRLERHRARNGSSPRAPR